MHFSAFPGFSLSCCLLYSQCSSSLNNSTISNYCKAEMILWVLNLQRNKLMNLLSI